MPLLTDVPIGHYVNTERKNARALRLIQTARIEEKLFPAGLAPTAIRDATPPPGGEGDDQQP